MKYIIAHNEKARPGYWTDRGEAISAAIEFWEENDGYVEVVTIPDPRCVFMIGRPNK